MYPYANHERSEVSTQASARQSGEPDERRCTDEKLIEMIEHAIQEEGTDVLFLEALDKIVRDAGEKEILHDIIMNERKHIKFFQEIYYCLTGKQAGMDGIPLPTQPDPTPKENYKMMFFHELEEASFLQTILFCLTDCEMRDLLAEIILEEQNNGIKFLFLYNQAS